MSISKLFISFFYGKSISKELNIFLSDAKREDSKSIAAIAIKAAEYEELLAAAIPDKILQMKFCQNDRISDSEALVFTKLLITSLNNLKKNDAASIKQFMAEQKNEEAIVLSRVSFIGQSALRLLIWNIAPYADNKNIELCKLISEALSKVQAEDFDIIASELIKTGNKNPEFLKEAVNSSYLMIKMPRWIRLIPTKWQ